MVARNADTTAPEGDSRAPRPRTRDGVQIGVVIGLSAAIVGILIAQWWLIAAVPAGAAGGAVAARRVRADRPISVRAVAYPALVADVVGAGSICSVFAIGSSVAGVGRSPVELVVAILADTAIALAFAGPLGLVLTVPAAWIGSLLLRRRVRAAEVSR